MTAQKAFSVVLMFFFVAAAIASAFVHRDWIAAGMCVYGGLLEWDNLKRRSQK